eukprot:TRINITY_DN255_c0_g3_i1.p1 TRINITY_DN255_c0_g3~~TRINITY_DN255_c0_g3_i1.p1  ORF type:complete len:411 (-),score=94.91 TRINITY_DN255_c0_g3_i1:93-1325(-)
MAPKGRKGASALAEQPVRCDEDFPVLREKAESKKAARAAIAEPSSKKARPPRETMEPPTSVADEAEAEDAPPSPAEAHNAPSSPSRSAESLDAGRSGRTAIDASTSAAHGAGSGGIAAAADSPLPGGAASRDARGVAAAADRGGGPVATDGFGRAASGLSDSVALPGRPEPGEAAASGDRHADRRILGAAAAIGGAAGMLLVGPVSGAALGAVAAYTATQEGRAGVATRKASALYLQATDRAVDEGLRAADRAVEEGRRRLDEGIGNAPLPAPLREGIRAVTGLGRPSERDACARRDPASREEARRIRERYPDRVPVICERSPYSDLPDIARKKFVIPGSMLCGEFKYIVHKHVAQAMGGAIRPEQTIYIFVNGISPKTSAPMSELYESFKADDGFLYVRYGAENTLGAC